MPGCGGSLPFELRLFTNPSLGYINAMNRTGLYIALALSLVVGLVFGLFPELDLRISARFFDAAAKHFPMADVKWAEVSRRGAMVVAWLFAVPSMIAVLVTEAFSIRHILAYAIFGALAGLCCYLAFIPFDTVAMTFEGIVRRHLEVMVGSGILGGVVYWLIAGRNAGVWREPAV